MLFLKKNIIENINSVLFSKSPKEDDGIPGHRFWFFIIFILLGLIAYYTALYLKYGNVQYLFMTGYNHELDKKIFAGLYSSTSLPIEIFRRFSAAVHETLPFCSVLLLFDVLRKKNRVHGKTSFIVAIIVVFLVMLSKFNMGGRSFAVYYLIMLGNLILLSFLNRSKRSLSIYSVPVLLFFTIFLIFGLASAQTIRNYGFKSAFVGSKSIFSKQGFSNALSKLLMKNDHQNKIVPKFLKNTHQNDVTLSSPKNPKIIQYPESQMNIVKTNEQILIEEKKFLQSYKWTHSISTEIAWVMLYFGRHKDFLGPDYLFRVWRDRILPINLETLKTKRVGNVVMLERGRKTESKTNLGLFGEGYACYGFLGGFINWGIICFLYGLLSKFVIITLMDINSSYVELIALSLAIYVQTIHITLIIPYALSIILVGFFFLFVISSVLSKKIGL